MSELRFGQMGIAQLTLRSIDPAVVWAELDAKVKAAPQLFTLAPLVLDLGQLSSVPSSIELTALIAAIREAGMLPVGLVHGNADSDALAHTLDLALFSKLRIATETAGTKEAPVAKVEPVALPEVETAAVPEAQSKAQRKDADRVAEPAQARTAGMHHAAPVRSGQQVYARGGDLTLTAMVGNGAEVIADGSIHIYGTLRGRALAGALGDGSARIYCQNFQAELISIAGQYRVFEDMPAELRGKPVQAWLENDKLRIAALG